ncbi:hypothetical protein NGRA_1419 [Nosema granulosis]|uniref:Integrase catalytic domain-containing protein n=1 Tax=Nosema granulosis TaxID=83296 RepID=A0A9P6GYH2_9MICR|nr:hypothetical protein NGRA_1419 [Nosema granulosis]
MHCLFTIPAFEYQGKQAHIISSRPFERLQIGLIDMRLYKEFNEQSARVLTVLDVYSKFGWTFPLATISSIKEVFKLEELFYMIGPPQILQSDNVKNLLKKKLLICAINSK